MKTLNKILLLIAFLSIKPLWAQMIKNDKPIKVNLPGIEVFVFATYSDNPDFHPYYYLPVNMRVSEKNGAPEFSFLTYRKDSNSQIEGGLMHFLLTWGLTTEQETLLDSIFRTQADTKATMMGGMTVSAESFGISSENPIAKILKNTISSAPTVPNSSGGKMALSFKLDASQAMEMQKALKKPKDMGDAKFAFHFKYQSRSGEMPWSIYLNLSDLFSYVNKFPQCVP